MGRKLGLTPFFFLVAAASCLGSEGDQTKGPGATQDGGTEGSTTCTGAACTAGCPTGFADCDGNTSNGCETQISNDVANCGACGSACGTANTTAAPTCVNNACVFSCAPGYLRCAADPSVGCDTIEDGNSCGGCGHACGGAECKAGVCDIIKIATGQNSPMGISVFTSSIYWAENGADTIRHAGITDAPCDGTGCSFLADASTAKLYSGGAGGSANPRHNPLATSSDGVKVYFTCKDISGIGQTGALSVSVAGGEVVLSGSGTGASYSILAENGYVFYTNRTGSEGVSTWDGNKMHIPRAATSQTTAQTPGVDALASDVGKLYFADGANGLIFSQLESDFPNSTTNDLAQPCDMNQSGTAPICNKVIAAPGVKLVAVATGVLFWSDATSIHRYKFLDASSGVVATNQNVAVMKADSSGVYWGRLDDNTFRMAKATDATCDGAACTLIAGNGVDTTPSGLALDMQNVYMSFSGSGLVARRVK